MNVSQPCIVFLFGGLLFCFPSTFFPLFSLSDTCCFASLESLSKSFLYHLCLLLVFAFLLEDEVYLFLSSIERRKDNILHKRLREGREQEKRSLAICVGGYQLELLHVHVPANIPVAAMVRREGTGRLFIAANAAPTDAAIHANVPT